LLLDEPTAALDPAATEAVEKLIRKLLDDGVSVLLVTHAEEQADRLGARKLTLRDGRLADPGGAP
ncbi:MAG: phosphate ABC transporter ATP-binding protein, partial [Hyphomicrobiales bacterium]|nr:phosphate ABC transporter ATP-binding protein [Hyphomicrobiales bacterium]